MPVPDDSHYERLERELHDKVDAEKTCASCGNVITVKMESYEDDGSARDFDYEAGHDRACPNYRKEI